MDEGIPEDVDVIVLGSGAAGLVAALAAAEAGARVALLEKASVLGGSTALSGGGCWVPGSSELAGTSDPDDREAALAYLGSLAGGTVRRDMAEIFVDEGPAAFDWLGDVAGITWRLVPGFPDYHPENPGGRPQGGRTIEPDLYSFARLGDWADRVARSRRSVHLRLIDTPLGGGTGFLDEDVLREREEQDLRGCGGALVGPLIEACLREGVSLSLGVAARDLVVRDGRVVGVEVVDSAGTTRIVGASRGVVLATGGFEWDEELVRAFLRGPMTSPAGIPTNTGDGLRMAMRAGAALANMPHAWWVPVARIPGDEAYGHPRSHLILRERTLPRGIIVNRSGRRFTNEASSYNALGAAFHAMDTATHDYVNLPCWLVFDQGFVDRYGFIGTRPGEPVADWVVTAATPAELAGRLGIEGPALEATVAEWNAMMAEGRDTDFGRGDSAYDLWAGDADLRGSRAATLGPLDEPPYYAIPLHSGTLGTCGGPAITVEGAVLDTSGRTIPGLFAAGNVAEAPTGAAYGGAGGTLGPIVTFARRAGRAAAIP